MRNYTMQQFYEDLYYGADIFFKLREYFYKIGAGIDSDTGCFSIYLEKSDADPDDSNAKETFYEVLFDEEDTDCEKLIERFLNAPLFDGKSFYEVEQDVEIIST